MSTFAYINLSTSFCHSILNKLQLEISTFSKNVKCDNVVFTPVNMNRHVKRQLITNNTTDPNVQGTGNVVVTTVTNILFNTSTTTTTTTEDINSSISQLGNTTQLQIADIEPT
ncbi:hypothetical protein EWB00_010383, partial [Schistosoma japonicum]